MMMNRRNIVFLNSMVQKNYKRMIRIRLSNLLVALLVICWLAVIVFEYLINRYRDCKEFVCVTKAIRVAK